MSRGDGVSSLEQQVRTARRGWRLALVTRDCLVTARWGPRLIGHRWPPFTVHVVLYGDYHRAGRLTRPEMVATCSAPFSASLIHTYINMGATDFMSWS